MKVVVGLGNPGRRYVGTRHNVGFEVVDVLARGPDCGPFRSGFSALVAELATGGRRILLVKPVGFMNLSGRPVREVLDFYGVEPADLMVVCDDFNLPLGKLRVRARGTHGGHNGLRNIQSHLRGTDYPRLRVGVGAPPEGQAVEHVLDRFGRAERAAMDNAVAQAAQAVLVWADQGIDECMNRFNG